MRKEIPIQNTMLTRYELGRFFIDQNCAGCKNCFSLAPSNIEFLSMTKRCSIVMQPMSDEELSILNKAYHQCPQHAFHDKADLMIEGMD
jgi:ferredoxin